MSLSGVAFSSHGISPRNGAGSMRLSVARYSAWRFSRRYHVISDPARQPQSRLLHRLGGQYRMVDAAKA
ncbi:Uncharacterised protein [Pseudescherichia vulneris]|nr:Uncharacterised protein [Pseudescherichia vulneris]